ncbi:adhesion G-protein coupled receptor G1 [Fundulus heteroclitus]|uniref:adhesion G-protein coupled receptor G1 n=1 Tax=Fundulus heteroclitus TaxID=8078 RepID=UPI00165B0EA5|nr:adhesion G-protein coupled receptor G1 [Fundulus heteroclitus]
MDHVCDCLGNQLSCDKLQAIRTMEKVLVRTEVTQTTFMQSNSCMAVLHKPPNSVSKGLDMYFNDTEDSTGKNVPSSKVRVQLPKEVKLGPDNTVVYLTIKLEVVWKGLEDLYDDRLIGLSVHGMEVSGLNESIKITFNMITSINETQKPVCVYLNDTTNDTKIEECDKTDYNQTHITCFSNHLTYFGVLLVSADLSPKDQEILFYITQIGCGISLLALVITVLLIIVKSEKVAKTSSNELCFYMALLLHYSLLASFTWMALEGFHLYLLLVKVFNIYVRRYLFKLSVVGWGLPAVIVSVMVIIDKDLYGHTPVVLSRPNETTVCYITDDTAKMVTTVGVFGLVFLFNVIMFGVIAKRFLDNTFSKQDGRRKFISARREVLTLLVLMVLLGLPWGLIFCSLGETPAPALYAFCIMNSLQGVFIFIYFVFHLVQCKGSASASNTETQISSIKT